VETSPLRGDRDAGVAPTKTGATGLIGDLPRIADRSF